jgi:drug/metabolite transporter (DMT)-like permease
MPLPSALLALLAAACFGGALIVVHFGLRHVPSHAAARMSLTTACLLFLLLAPALLDLSAWHAGAAAIFALVGLFYPAAVTVLTYQSNRLIGPTLTGTISSTTPIFATALAVAFLGERLTPAIAAGGCVVVAALVTIAWRPGTPLSLGWRIALPLCSAALRALAQALSKFGLALWPSPYAATLLGYTVSAAAIWSVPHGSERPPGGRLRRAFPWFAAAGVLNGSGLLLLNYALQTGRVSIVAPLAALYPLFTMLFSAVFIRTEVLTRRVIGGALLAVTGVVLLVSG